MLLLVHVIERGHKDLVNAASKIQEVLTVLPLSRHETAEIGSCNRLCHPCFVPTEF